MNVTNQPSQALAQRWFQKAEVEAAYTVRAWVRSRLGLER